MYIISLFVIFHPYFLWGKLRDYTRYTIFLFATSPFAYISQENNDVMIVVITMMGWVSVVDFDEDELMKMNNFIHISGQ